MVFFSSDGTPKDPSRDRRRVHYKCPDCPNEFTITLEVGDRKLKRWCRNCRHFIYPDQVTNI
jgi:hypothetical protein